MKYIELFNDSFPANINEKCSPENGPYVCYSKAVGHLLCTIVPNSIEVPADNEIWYTSIDGNSVYASTIEVDKGGPYFTVISNIYENGKGIITFQDPITGMPTNSAGETLFPIWKTNNAERLSTIILPKSAKGILAYSLGFDKSNLQYIEVQETIESIGIAGNFPIGSNHYIKYNGTKSQWNNVKVRYPDEVTRPITVRCTDGDIVIPVA